MKQSTAITFRILQVELSYIKHAKNVIRGNKLNEYFSRNKTNVTYEHNLKNNLNVK